MRNGRQAKGVEQIGENIDCPADPNFWTIHQFISTFYHRSSIAILARSCRRHIEHTHGNAGESFWTKVLSHPGRPRTFDRFRAADGGPCRSLRLRSRGGTSASTPNLATSSPNWKSTKNT